MHGSSRLPAGFRSRLSRGWWLSPSCSSRFGRFGRDTSSRLRYCGLSHFGRSWLSRFGDRWLSRLAHSGLSHFGDSWLPRFGHGRLSRFDDRGLFSFDHDLNRGRQFRLGRFPSAMVARMQQLDAVCFFLRTQLCVFTASAFVLEVFRNCFRCHGRSVADWSSSKLSNCDH